MVLSLFKGVHFEGLRGRIFDFLVIFSLAIKVLAVI